MTLALVIFILIQFVNVMLSTMKSIATVKGTKMMASLMNAISYTFGAVVIKLITQQSFPVVVVVTLLTNLVGVYAAKWLLEKMEKEKLWTIVATVKKQEGEHIESELKRRDIQYTIAPAYNSRLIINIFSYTKAESELIKEILVNDKIKYTVIESLGKLD